MSRVRPWRLAAGFAAAAAVLVFDSSLHHAGELGARPARAAAVALAMAVWWLTEALPIHWTACVPLAAFPLAGVFGRGPAGDLAAAVAPYFDPYCFLFAGGMMIAAGIEQQGLHRRLALGALAAIGTDPRRLLAGVLVATASVSLWISNTATAAMMLPIGLALVAQLEARDGRRLERYGMALLLAIAWGANLGGIGTKIGTPPNAQLAGFLERSGTPVSFFEFLLLGLPFVALMLPAAWAVLWRLGRRDAPAADAREVVRTQLAALGRVSGGERAVAAAFLAVAALWIASSPLTAALGARIPGLRTAHVEGGAAMAVALALLVLPAPGGGRLLPWRALSRVPWSTLLLLGGGFALAAAVHESGLAAWMAGRLAGIAALPPLAQLAAASTATVAISALASNSATTAVMLVVLAEAAAPAVRVPVLVAATIAASCDFALPVGTPPNAIVFGSGYVRIPVMARYGAVLDLFAALAAALWCAWAVPLVLG
ncbi:MAG: sodium:sulfate symporter [Acidobacteria bacterium]|nr:sodium:sulfate symporter [Acidobacteriota bacterium]